MGSKNEEEEEERVVVLSLENIRQSLIRQEDTIIFSLIERAQYPLNSPTYDPSYSKNIHGFHGSLMEFIFKQTESLHAKLGRYKNEEENAFFPDDQPEPFSSPINYPQGLYAASASVNINKTIWSTYLKEILPLFTAEGDNRDYGSTAVCDLACLQALSRRIHFGKFVAEVKFRDAPQEYEAAIRSKDREALMNLLTFKEVEEMVKKRVQNKAKVFGQEIGSDSHTGTGKQKIDPQIVSHVYEKWVIPLTKLVEVEYLLRRLD